MMAWHDRKYADAGLRLVGLALLSVAVLVGRHLFAAPNPQGKVTASAYLLALIGMASACAGAALAVLGRHLFDEVELSERWTIHVPPRRNDR
jgi:hypothetical protein